MTQLIILEWKKNRVGRYALGALILTALLALFLFAQCYLGIANDPVTGMPDAAPGTFNITSQVELVTDVCFLIFSGTMLAGCVTSAYRKRTMALMFTYPVPRRRLLAAQILAVWLFCAAAVVLAKLFLYALLFAAGQFMTPDFPLDYTITGSAVYMQIAFSAVKTATVSLLAMLAGRVFRSSKATLIAAVLLVLALNGTVGQVSLAENLGISLAFMAAGVAAAALSLIGADRRDVA